jgi:hypothetical protein
VAESRYGTDADRHCSSSLDYLLCGGTPIRRWFWGVAGGTRAEGRGPRKTPGHHPGIAGAGLEPATPAL